jgi:uncharacterized membrane protein (DUF373 family)
MDIKKFLKPQAIHGKIGDLLETLEEIIVFILTILLLILSLRALYDIAVDLFVTDISFISLIPKFIYVFILIELFRLMIVYLLERRLDTALIIKTTLIAILRETIIKAPHLTLPDYIGLSLLLIVLSSMYYIPKYAFKSLYERLGQHKEEKSSKDEV